MIKGLCVLSLTARAKVGASLSYHEALDGGIALGAELVFLPEDLQGILITAGLSGGVLIVTNCSAAVVNGFTQDFTDGIMQALRFLEGEASCLPLRMDAGFKESLAGIDIPYSSNEALLQEKRFYRHSMIREALSESLSCEIGIKRFWSKLAEN